MQNERVVTGHGLNRHGSLQEQERFIIVHLMRTASLEAETRYIAGSGISFLLRPNSVSDRTISSVISAIDLEFAQYPGKLISRT
jgi:hypothetical protein